MFVWAEMGMVEDIITGDEVRSDKFDNLWEGERMGRQHYGCARGWMGLYYWGLFRGGHRCVIFLNIFSFTLQVGVENVCCELQPKYSSTWQ